MSQIGVAAAGAEQTAAVAARILRSGGTATDAAVAACFAIAATEPTLTSLAGAGAFMHLDGQSGQTTVCDFFANAPGLGGPEPEQLDFFSIELNFGPAVQRFYIGAASAAVPGAIPGLCSAHERWGRLPLSEVVAPACELLREGVVLLPENYNLVTILEPILMHNAKSRAQWAPRGELLLPGERFRLPQLADTLEQMVRQGWRSFYDNELGPMMLQQFGPRSGGLLTAEDLAAYEVCFREPIEVDYRGHRVSTNPPPAMGGTMITLMLSLLEQVPLGQLVPGTPEHAAALCRAMRVADEARAAGGDALSPSQRGRWRERFAQLADVPLGQGPTAGGGPSSTTHVSVLDRQGNGAAVTFSHGEGNGQLIGETGISMNNLMGEADLFPGGFHSWTPGARLSTMVSPTALRSPAGDVAMMGTGGANRIRSAILQTLVALVDHGMAAEGAVRHPRLHLDAGVLNVETYGDVYQEATLSTLGADTVVRFTEPNLFFGGVHLVRRLADGSLQGAGDPRRGGATVMA